MIVVLDTNVIVSAMLSAHGAPARIINRWEAGRFDVVTSQALIGELERVLTYPRVRRYLKFSEQEIDAFLNRLSAAAVAIEPPQTLEVIETDPADNRVLECAIAGGATYIVTGDAHLLDLKAYQQIVILEPAAFLAVLKLEEQ
jgi:putative PIN family toxin of toxin-antitoxin system